MTTMQTQSQLQEVGGSTSQPHQEVGVSTMPTLSQPQEVGGFTRSSPLPNSSASKQKRPSAMNRKKEPAPKRKRTPLVPSSPLVRPLVTSQQALPTAKRVRSPIAKKQLKSPAAKRAEKQLKSPTPMVTRSPTMRLMMSPVFIGAPSPDQPQSSPGLPSLAALRSPSPDHYCSLVRNPSMSPAPLLSLVDETRAQSDYHPGSISAKGGKPRKLLQSGRKLNPFMRMENLQKAAADIAMKYFLLHGIQGLLTYIGIWVCVNKEQKLMTWLIKYGLQHCPLR
ncbi:hypothetical protein ACP70R_021422 [Stipagrostis hirtigluma subsp. patula]